MKYINGFEVKRGGDRKIAHLRIYLRYVDGRERVLTDIQRVSKPGRRLYVKSDRIPKVLNGFGSAILSTSRGVMTDEEARSLNVGGEILCSVW